MSKALTCPHGIYSHESNRHGQWKHKKPTERCDCGVCEVCGGTQGGAACSPYPERAGDLKSWSLNAGIDLGQKGSKDTLSRSEGAHSV